MKKINNEYFKVNNTEFVKLECKKFETLDIITNLGLYERLISLIKELAIGMKIKHAMFSDSTHGGFIPIKSSTEFDIINILNCDKIHLDNFKENVIEHNIKNINFIEINNIDDKYKQLRSIIPSLLFCESFEKIDINIINTFKPIIITTFNKNLTNINYIPYNLSNTLFYIYVPEIYNSIFYTHFRHYIIPKNNNDIAILNYDNLIHLCIMVKNAGELFEQMLIDNLDIIDRWTILDTGSTDGTIETIKKILVGKKQGKLYEEPFINFRDSRNRCLDLAAKDCKFNVMLDDTYVVNNLRIFLNEVRGDQNANSYSIFIKSDDIEYLSNRITKTNDNLRYIYTMHEIIQDENNFNVGIPLECCFIEDRSNAYMKNRSDERKYYDLKCLYEMIEEDPNDSRQFFYIAQTYKMLGNIEKASEFYFKRAFHKNDGFGQEKMDALFEFTRINQLHLNMEWSECEKYYNLCTEWQPSRPEGNYMIGNHYYNIEKYDLAYYYFKKTFEIGFPHHHQYSLKPTLSYLFTPYHLTTLCYIMKDFNLGLKATTLYLQKNKPTENLYSTMNDWHQIYLMLNAMPALLINPIIPEKEIFCFVADGGYTQWSGSNILTSGVGGSETWIIETARHVSQLKGKNTDVYVFCNCEKDEVFENVNYVNLSKYLDFISKTKIQNCIISRYSEYIPATIHSHVENIHIILHDICLTGNIIPIDPKIKNIFCLTEWHANLFLQSFPQFKNIIHSTHYGIDFDKFSNLNTLTNTNTSKKIKNSFIYSSFPNRGLLVLLKLWVKIKEYYNDAILNIFTDVNNKWANTMYPQELEEIRFLLNLYKTKYSDSVINHGWVDKKTLANYWKTSEIWFYPCKFAETFCLTALEAAATKTFVITNDLGALVETVGDRGVIVPGNSQDEKWQNSTLKLLFQYLDNPDLREPFINKNYNWALTHTWKKRTEEFLTFFNDTLSIEKNNNITMTIKEISDVSSIILLEKISKIYYINLDTREDRKNHFLNQVKEHNIPQDKIQRYNAINGSSYNFTEKELKLFNNVDYLNMDTKLNIMGNQLSHYNIFKEMKQNNYKYIIICQDDIVFKQGFTSYIDNVLRDIPTNAEIIHFGFHKYGIRDVFIPWDLSSNNLIPYSKNDNNTICNLHPIPKALYNSNNTLGYIITLNGAINYVNYIETMGFKYATDHDINTYLCKKNIYYGTKMVLATSNPIFGSDVFENMENKNTHPYNLTKNNNFLNYNGEYNWTNDFPKNYKIKFISMLLNFLSYPSCNILEIGCHVGTSIIGMLQYLPNSQATIIGIDNDDIFYNNIKVANMESRIEVFKNFSCINNKTFEFININGNINGNFDDLSFVWNLLNVNGILCIFKFKNDDIDIQSINSFFEKINSTSILLDKEFGLFIKKIN